MEKKKENTSSGNTGMGFLFGALATAAAVGIGKLVE
jgi:hypothetical protein